MVKKKTTKKVEVKEVKTAPVVEETPAVEEHVVTNVTVVEDPGVNHLVSDALPSLND